MKIFPARFFSSVLLLISSLALCGPAHADTMTAAVGQKVSIEVTANGSQPFTYQWYKNGTVIPNATSSTYVINAVAMSDDATYTATVTNSMDTTTSDAAVLTVIAALTPPTISTQPVSQTVTAGTAVTVSVTASGTGTLKYQWTKGGVNIAGATSSSYTISNPATTDSGSYAVMVTNTVGTASSTPVTSNAATLTVNAPILPTTITSQPTALTVTTGQSASFSVTATGSGTLTYQWRKGGTNISGATSSSYTISGATTNDAGSYSVVVTGTGGSVTSNSVTLTVNAPTVITQQPTALAVISGQSATLSVAATGTSLTYQWRKGGTNISGATSASYTIATTTSADAGSYSVVVTGTGGSVTSNAVALTVNPAPIPGAPDGYATLVTGGAAGTAITVTTAAELRTYAESAPAYVITVSGTINLSGSVAVKSNKTIQGANASSTIVGQLDLGSGVNNVIIRGLNVTNTTGNGITLRNASSVFITHCSVYDCGGNLIEISNGSDYVTVSWSEFYYSSTSFTNRKALFVGVAGSETKALHVTLHHNWWSDLCDQSMPNGTWGYVHLYSNCFGATVVANAFNNTSGTVASDNAQFLVERNNYNRVKDPLYKENLDTTKAMGRIRAMANTFTNCTGKAVDAGTDSVFTPIYSYEMYHQDDVDAALPSLVGNTGGASSTTPTSSTASVSDPSSAVSPGASFTLTALPTGFTATSYQWRRNNVDISGATSASYSVGSMQSANAGTYTVMLGLSSGSYVVSSPLDVLLGTDTGNDGGSSSGGAKPAAAAAGGGGGGAPGIAYLAALLALGFLRAISRRRIA
ncbi:MAG: immunoglobulin domain-containing protein [Nibricoccus sp.]